jgi:hypothetical protein
MTGVRYLLLQEQYNRVDTSNPQFPVQLYRARARNPKPQEYQHKSNPTHVSTGETPHPNKTGTIESKIPVEPTERIIDLALTRPTELTRNKSLKLQFSGLSQNRKLVVVNDNFLIGNIL